MRAPSALPGRLCRCCPRPDGKPMTSRTENTPAPDASRTGAPAISFVIPALNEERNIVVTIESIRRHTDAQLSYEIIVVDHGSSDRTADEARKSGAQAYVCPGGTIGSLRNYGAKQAAGHILVFLDADVNLTVLWQRNFPGVRRQLERRPWLITGSHCTAPADGTWIERYWFRNFAIQAETTHIGSGHLIVRSDTFREIGGFDAQLKTGEDYEFCRRAIGKGGQLVNDMNLETIHRGFPNGIRAFVRREAWHGRGDLESIRTFLRSKVAIGSTLFIMFHIMILFGLFAPGRFWGFTAAGVIMLAALLLGSAIHRYRHCALPVIGINALLFYFYYLGRSLALFGMSRWWRGSRTVSDGSRSDKSIDIP